MEIKEILSKCDHTLLAQTATWEDIKAICDDGIKYQTASVCIPPCFVKQASEYSKGRVVICTVIGFPNGYNTTAVKEFETKDAIANGADEIDMVINIGELKAGNYDYVENEIRTLKKRAATKSSKSSSKLAFSPTTKKSRCANSSPKRARISSRPPRASRKRAQRLRISSFLQSTWAKRQNESCGRYILNRGRRKIR